MKTCALLLGLLLSGCVYSGYQKPSTTVIYDSNWNVRGYVRGNTIYDSRWNVKGYTKGSTIYSPSWSIKGRTK
jgi:hypothetical protein